MLLKKTVVASLFFSSLLTAALAKDAFAYEVLADCNAGAAVVDYEFVDLGMRGGTYHLYQFVIRNQGIIDYLARQGAISHRALISGGREAVFHFRLGAEPYSHTTVFSDGGRLQQVVSGGWGDDGFVYELVKEGQGIRFLARSPQGYEANWFFESCEARIRERRPSAPPL